MTEAEVEAFALAHRGQVLQWTPECTPTLTKPMEFHVLGFGQGLSGSWKVLGEYRAKEGTREYYRMEEGWDPLVPRKGPPWVLAFAKVEHLRPPVDRARFPHACPRCGRPAYRGLNLVECSAGCR